MAGDWRILLPETATNLVTNPSFETDVETGYTAIGGAIDTVTTYARRGFRSMACTPVAGVNDGVYFGTIAMTSGTSYTFSVDFRGVVNIPYKIYIADTSANLKGTATTLTATGDWERVSVTWACDSTTTYRLYVTKNNNASTGVFYTDGWQCVALAHDTSYIDGYVRGFCADGYYWNGTPHASTSTRAAKERSGGQEIDLRTSYDFSVRYGVGLGMPPITHHVQGMALLPGALYQGHKVQPRALDLVSGTEISTVAGVHAARKNFINACKPDRVSPEQPVVFRYYGANANKPVEFYGYYDSGMEFNLSDGRIDQPVARFICYDPYAYELGDGAASLTSSLTASYFSTAAKIAGVWANFGPVSAGAACAASLLYNGVYYVSMNSININAIAAADYVAKWTGAAWAAFGASGFDNTVTDIRVAPDGTFWAIGLAHTMVGTTVNHIGKSTDSGATWATAGGTSCDGTVNDIVWDQSGNIYACGDFSKTPDNHDAVRIMTTANSGTHWTALGTGLNVEALCMAVSPANELYVGGSFTTANGVTVNYIARWTGATFATVGGTSCDSAIKDMCFDPAGNLYICGAFTAAPDGTAITGIAKWNGKVWSSLGGSIGTGVGNVFFHDGLLYACGGITSVGGAIINSNVAVWNGSTWHSLDFDAATNVNDIQFGGNGEIYLAMADAAAANMISSAATMVTNNGSTIAFPEVHIKRSGGTSASVSYLKNETTGATLWLSYDLLDGEELTIRTQPTERTITSSFFGTVWRAILRESDFSEFNLMPGANTISLFVLPVGAPTVTAWLQYRVPHWGADTVAA